MDTPAQNVPQTPVPASPKKNTMTITVIVVVIIGAVLGGAYVFTQYPSWKSAADIKAALTAFDANDLDGSLAKVDALLLQSPNSSAILTMKALVLAQKGSLEFKEMEYGAQAVVIAKQAIEADPTNSEAHRVLGYSYEIQQLYAKAHEEYAKALSLDAGNAFALFDDAHAYDLEGNSAKAEAGYRAAITIDATIGKFHNGLARVLLAKGDVDGALSEYERAYTDTTNAREKAEAGYSIGTLFLQKKQIEKALPYFTSATKDDPSYSLGWYGLGTALFLKATATSTNTTNLQRGHDINTSFEYLGKAIELNSNQTLAYIQLAIEKRTIGNVDQALAELGHAATVVNQDITLSASAKITLSKNIDQMMAMFKAAKKK